MLFSNWLSVVATGLMLVSGVHAQGDDCSQAMPIGGIGSWPVDSGALTDSDFAASAECIGTIPFYSDGFYQWTAAAAGNYEVAVTGVGQDAILRVLEGDGCLAECVGTSLQLGNALVPKVLLIGVQVGDTFLLQAGTFHSGGGVLNLSVGVFMDACTAAPDDGFEENDDCMNPSAIGAGTYSNLVATVLDSDFYSVTVPAYHRVQVTWSSGTTDLSGRLFGAPCGAVVQSYDSIVFYDNNAGVDETVNFELYVKSQSGTQNCAQYSMTVRFIPDHCLLGTEDLLENNDYCGAAIPLVSGVYRDLRVSVGDPDYFEIVVPPLHGYEVQLTTNDGLVDMGVTVAGCGSTFVPVLSSGYTINNPGTNDRYDTFRVTVDPASGSADCAGYNLVVDIFPDPCLSFVDDPLGAGRSCATALDLDNGTYPGLSVSFSTPDFYSFCVGRGDTVNVGVLFTHAAGDVEAYLWDSTTSTCGYGFGAGALIVSESETDHESLTWTNNTGSNVNAVLMLVVANTTPFDCNDYDLILSGVNNCAVDASFCGDPMPNSSGEVTLIDGVLGSTPGSGLHLESTGGPAGEFGFFLVGSESELVGVPAGNGTLCLSLRPGETFERYNVAGTAMNSIGYFGTQGRFIALAGNAVGGFGFDVPSGLQDGSVMTAGETWHFQLWHRDTAAGTGFSGLSNALHVSF
ncbi:MAG: PPC domain-containing protein [Planctomycetota bacterium]|nr:PPC domain-containing protein [Planctomycetota bacterium]